MMASLRCGAKTRGGGSCRAPAIAGKVRCRMHGGANGSGAPQGNQNAFKHGAYANELLDAVKEGKKLERAAREMIKKLGL